MVITDQFCILKFQKLYEGEVIFIDSGVSTGSENKIENGGNQLHKNK